ncbi:MAG: ABC transporter ATP-binding protein [Acidimicrobiales bacterium]
MMMMQGGPHGMLGRDREGVKGAKVGRAVLRRVWAFAGAYRWMIAGFVATIVAGAAFGVATPLLVRSIIDDAIPRGDRGLVNVLAGLIVLAALADAALGLVGRWWSARIGEGLIYDLRSALFDHVQRMPIAFFTNSQTGTLISRLNNDVVGAQNAVTGTLGNVVSNVVMLVATLITMMALEWRLTIMALAILPMFVLPSKRVGRKLQAISRESMQLNAAMNTTMTERFGVSGALLVKLFGRHDDERDAFARRAARVRDIGIRTALYMRLFFLGLGVVAAVGSAAVYWVGSQLVISGSLGLGDLVALGILVTRLYGPLTGLTNARVDVMTALVSFDRVFEVLDAPNPIADRPGAGDLGRSEGRIELDHVWFAYPAPQTTTIASLATPGVAPLGDGPAPTPVLRDVDARIEPGQLVALVGPSGGGKSTLASLIPRLYDVTEGAVRIDGIDVRDLTQHSLRQAIGVVSQDPHLFHETVAENLRYAKPDATAAELEAACRAAQIHEVVAALPEGYDTIVGERGYRLSGGEKQRLAIARMLLKNPSIVILDEATSHLDSENEAQVQRALDQALEGRTSIVIAHRLSTITAADQILVIDDGSIVERGVHAELLAAHGLYADLYHTLVRDSAAPAPA